jgi:hypothetical protein
MYVNLVIGTQGLPSGGLCPNRKLVGPCVHGPTVGG